MKLTRTLFAAAAISAFALPAAAQDPAAIPAMTPPVAPTTTPPAEQPVTPPANPVAAQPAATPEAAPQPMMQTAPAAPAAPATPASAPTAATAADLVTGAAVLDQTGQPVGTIESADATGAVVSTGNARGRLNLDAFYKNERGLIIGYSRAQFENLVSGLGGPEAPDAEETAAPATANPAPAVQPEAASPEAPE